MDRAIDIDFRTISVVGLGYIGLPTATVLASRQREVIGVDINQHAVDTINQGRIHIVEPDLDMLVRAAVSQGYLRATTEPEPADAFLIAVPTPFLDNKQPDLSYIEAAARAIAPVLKRGDLVVLESTSPVGATEQLSDWLSAQRPDLSFPHQQGEESDIRVAHCPERVLPGHVLREPGRERPHHRRHDAQVQRSGATAVRAVRARPLHRDRCAHGRDVQADGECIPRRQHRLCQ